MRRYTAVTMLRSILLASTSRYRCELLQRLRIPFDVKSPGVDETPHANETPEQLALRLAEAKAYAVAQQFPAAIIIASDQVADLNGTALNKPETHERALAQLEAMQGQRVIFHTALAVLDTASNRLQIDNVPTTVQFRRLPTAALDAYLRADQPYDCAGAAKIESLGITLLESVESSDPTALIGLPLIRLTRMLAACGVRLPAFQPVQQ